MLRKSSTNSCPCNTQSTPQPSPFSQKVASVKQSSDNECLFSVIIPHPPRRFPFIMLHFWFSRLVSHLPLHTEADFSLLPSTLDLNINDQADEYDESQGYLRGIRILSGMACNAHFCSQKTKPNAISSHALRRTFYCFGWSEMSK